MELLKDSLNVVLIGSFNPVIYHPSWFKLHKILADYDEKEFEINITHPEITRFSLPWLFLEATQNRFLVKTDDPSCHDRIRDFLSSTLKLLPHTPIKQMGINRVMHFSVSNDANWHKIGDNLAPKKNWQKALTNPGLLLLKIQAERTDELNGVINISIEPSKEFQHSVAVNVNSHIELVENSHDCTKTINNILFDKWDNIIKQIKSIGETVIKESLNDANNA